MEELSLTQEGREEEEEQEEEEEEKNKTKKRRSRRRKKERKKNKKKRIKRQKRKGRSRIRWRRRKGAGRRLRRGKRGSGRRRRREGGEVPVRSSSLTETHLAYVTIHTGGRPTACVAPYTHCAVCHYAPRTHPQAVGMLMTSSAWLAHCPKMNSNVIMSSSWIGP